ncbi:putative bifunctional diguanylate cyclase/phosphodiesterase [Methylotenera sp. L2L1]|uniref:putative bifunctional diguanylate cyclase/phosphodiesterase n=1 Tax=Methylotenera sp. L2L1 TaxID=1502770 RepID=UPI000A5AFE8E|nr:GGDEF domain-containing phosphodiesterase [Methylotenera sp. L2L1]
MNKLFNQLFSKKIPKLDLIVLRIVGIYIAFGLLWILTTDSALFKLITDHEEFSLFNTYKGVAFILVTAVILYSLFRQTLQQQKCIEESLQASEERWKFALEGSGDGVWDWDIPSDHVFRSSRWHEIYGYAENEIAATATAGRELVHPDDLAILIGDVQNYFSGNNDVYISEFRLRCKDGSWKWTLARGMTVSRSKDGKPLRMIGTHTDITNRKTSEAQVTHLAHYDQLTGLPNRVLFLDRFRQDIKKAQRTGQTVTLMFLDLDKFKEVNDSLGHDMGDMLLKNVAQRLESCVRESDTVARMGGDEFTIILNDMNSQINIERIAQDILDKVTSPFHLGDEVIHVSTSIGISNYPKDGSEVELLLKNADQAMYAAKEQGRNRFQYFTPIMQEEALKRMRLISDLWGALNDNQFRVYYQPIVDLATGAIYKAEALIRWQHPTRGLVSPDEFIPVAEDTGLIVDIGDWLFNEVASQTAKWKQHYPNLQVSVNKSPVQFRSVHDNCTNWIEQLKLLGLSGDSFIVEITEGLLLDARESVINQLNAFREAGIKVAIDDFGTGYSSLAYLRRFDIDYVKIDRSFTSNISPNSSDMVLCEAIIEMSHKLGMQVIAEGVETHEQRDLLRNAGCDFAQGYLYSRPVMVDQFENLLNATQSNFSLN